MLHPKRHYRALALPEGWCWTGFDAEDGLHSFQRQVIRPLGHPGGQDVSYVEIRCRESEITDGSLIVMIRRGWTR